MPISLLLTFAVWRSMHVGNIVIRLTALMSLAPLEAGAQAPLLGATLRVQRFALFSGFSKEEPLQCLVGILLWHAELTTSLDYDHAGYPSNRKRQGRMPHIISKE
jgi:hypothetical protein